MSKSIEAVYEGGRLRPLESLSLSEGDRVRLELKLVPGDAEAKLAALDSLLDSCAEMTDRQWEVFEEASTAELNELKRELARYFAGKAIAAADRAWDDRDLSNQDMDAWIDG